MFVLAWPLTLPDKEVKKREIVSVSEMDVSVPDFLCPCFPSKCPVCIVLPAP